MTFTMMHDGSVVMRVKRKRLLSLAGSLKKAGRKAVPTGDLSR